MGREVSRLIRPLLARWELIQTTDACAKQAKHFDLQVVEAFNDVVNLTLYLHPDAVNPFEELEEPTQGRPLGRLVDLIGERFMVAGSLLTHPTLRHRIGQRARVLTINSPCMREGFFTNNDETTNSGSFRNRNPLSTWDCAL